MGTPISSMYRNIINAGHLTAKGEAKLAEVEKAAKNIGPEISSGTKKLLNKVMDFNDEDLKKLGTKLDTYFDDKEVAKLKETATSLINALDEIAGAAVEKLISTGMKEFGQKLLGKENYEEFAKVAKGVKKGVKHFNNFLSEIKADQDISRARTGASGLSKAFYRQ